MPEKKELTTFQKLLLKAGAKAEYIDRANSPWVAVDYYHSTNLPVPVRRKLHRSCNFLSRLRDPMHYPAFLVENRPHVMVYHDCANATTHNHPYSPQFPSEWLYEYDDGTFRVLPTLRGDVRHRAVLQEMFSFSYNYRSSKYPYAPLRIHTGIMDNIPCTRNGVLLDRSGHLLEPVTDKRVRIIRKKSYGLEARCGKFLEELLSCMKLYEAGLQMPSDKWLANNETYDYRTSELPNFLVEEGRLNPSRAKYKSITTVCNKYDMDAEKVEALLPTGKIPNWIKFEEVKKLQVINNRKMANEIGCLLDMYYDRNNISPAMLRKFFATAPLGNRFPSHAFRLPQALIALSTGNRGYPYGHYTSEHYVALVRKFIRLLVLLTNGGIEVEEIVHKPIRGRIW